MDLSVLCLCVDKSEHSEGQINLCTHCNRCICVNNDTDLSMCWLAWIYLSVVGMDESVHLPAWINPCGCAHGFTCVVCMSR